MAERRRGLGRGLGALIPSEAPTDTEPVAEQESSSARNVKQNKASVQPKKQGAADTPADSATAVRASGGAQKASKGFVSTMGNPESGADSARKAGSAKRSSSTTANTSAKAKTGTSSGAGAAPSDSETPDATGAGLPASARKTSSRGDSRETSARIGRSGASSEAGKPVRKRRDMGQALRSTTSVSRPVDMFFLSSSDVEEDEHDSVDVVTVATPGVPDDVSRETSVRDVSETAPTEVPGTEFRQNTESAAQAGPASTTPSDDSSTQEKSALEDSAVSSAQQTEGKAEAKGAARAESPASVGDVAPQNRSDGTVSASAGKASADKSTRTGNGTASKADASAMTEPPKDTSEASSPSKNPKDGPSSGSSQGLGVSASDVSRETLTTSASVDELQTVPGARFAEIAVKDIHPNRKQPRQVFDEDELAELAFSVKELGVLQPIVVRPSREENAGRFELVMGERRWRAVQEAGLETIPAIVRETADNDLLRDALLENLHRAQLNPLEEAAAYQQLMEEFGATQEQLSERIGRSRPQISNTLRLLRLPALVQRRVAAGVLSSGHARALLALSDPAEMERLAQRIVAEGLSVRATEEAVALADGLKRHPTKRKAPANRHDDRLGYIADAFSDKLDTSVKIQLGARKGKMTIEFASVEDLNRIIDVLDPKLDPEA